MGLVRPAVEAAGLECHRDDDDFVSRSIALNIWKKIEDADVVLCDVSSSNPNVFLELGWAIRADKPYVVMMDDVTKVPFDVADLNRLNYPHDLRPFALQAQIPQLARMIENTLRDSSKCSVVGHLGIPSPRLGRRARPRCTVDIYYHDTEFTRQQARAVEDAIRRVGISTHTMEHTGPTGPDAAFIGALVEAEDARFVLGLLPYRIRFLFRPDYPESEGGDSSGYKIGIGYTSKYNEGLRNFRAEPSAISAEQLASLLEPEQANSSFHRLLWDLTTGPSRDDARRRNR